MSTQALVPTNGSAATQLAFDLGADLGSTFLNIRDPEITYLDWENIGRAVGFVGNAWQWWVGDWLNAGEALFGREDQFAQAVDDRQARHDLALRITGKDPGTIANIASVCRRVSREVRRPELEYTYHTKVTSLSPEEQVEWLQKCIDAGWSVAELAQAIKDSKAPTSSEDDTDKKPGPSGGDSVSNSERRDEVLALVIHQSLPTSDGGFYQYPAEVYAQARAVLGYD